MKRKLQQIQVARKLRSTLPRRQRKEISPIIVSAENKHSVPHLAPAGDSTTASSHITREREVSCGFSRVSVNKNSPTKSAESHRITTRLYSRRKEIEKRQREVSESSCIDSSSNLTVDRNELSTADFPDKSFKPVVVEERESKIPAEIKRNELSTGEPSQIAKSVLFKVRNSKIESHTKRNCSNTVCSDHLQGDEAESDYSSANIFRQSSSELSTADFPTKITKSEAVTVRENQIPPNCSDLVCTKQLLCDDVESNYSTADFPAKITKSANVEEIESKIVSQAEVNCSDLVCTEQLLCDEDESDYSSAFSDLKSDILGSSSEYTPSIWLESGSEFSERSMSESNPSPTFALFLQYSHQFCRSSISLCSKSGAEVENEYRAFPVEDEDDELSYKMLRKRERREVYMQDYAEEYCSTTDYGPLVIQQRLQMVHWIVEQSTSKELQKETMFLGVNLLDRFLSKGFFKNKRNLQVAGIACLALATRIEENQPFNSVQKRTFCVGNYTYSRCEVVAMEWLVQEVLNFQCFMPTIYNFLWFYLKAAQANEEVEKTAKYLAVLALLGHEQLCFWPSTVAAGLVILASLSANQDVSCNRVLETHVRTKEDDLSGCIKSLEWLAKYAC